MAASISGRPTASLSTLERLSRPPCTCDGWTHAVVTLDSLPEHYSLVPAGFFESLTRLTTLVITGCALAELPFTISLCPSLTQLDVSRNALSTLPPEIITLTALVVLRADSNELTELPHGLGTLTALLELSLADNRFDAVPPPLAVLPALRKLSLAQNAIDLPPPTQAPHPDALVEAEIAAASASTAPPPPSALSALFPPSLEVLDLSLNALTSLHLATSWAASLPALRKLSLAANAALSTAAPLAPPPPLLAFLDLSGTSIPWFPAALARSLPNLTTLRLASTPLITLPPAAMALTALTSLTFQDVVCRASGDAELGTSLLHLFRATAICPHPVLLTATLELAAYVREQLAYDAVRAGIGPPLIAALAHPATSPANAARVLELLLPMIDSGPSRAQLLLDGLAPALSTLLTASPPASQLASLVAIVAARLTEFAPAYVRTLFLHPSSGGAALLATLATLPPLAAWSASASAALRAPPHAAGVLFLEPREALQVCGRDGARPYAPYVHCKVYGASVSSKCDYTGGHTPSWKGASRGTYKHALAVHNPAAAVVHVAIYDYRLTSRDVLLGVGSFPLADLVDGHPADVWIKLIDAPPPSDLEAVRATGLLYDSLPPPPSFHGVVTGTHRSAPPLYASAAAASVTLTKLRIAALFVALPPHILPTLPTKDKVRSTSGAWRLVPPPSPVDVIELARESAAAAVAHRRAAGLAAAARATVADGPPTLLAAGPSFAAVLPPLAVRDVYLALDASNAVYYADTAARFVHEDSLTKVQFSTRASSQKYALAELDVGGETMLVASFMGTYGVGDVVADLDLGAAPTGVAGKVHRGMYKRAASIPLLALVTLLRTAPPGVRLMLTGHSLGGGVAVLVFLRLAAEAGLAPSELARIFVVTFGQPLVGDAVFAAWMADAGLAGRITTVVNAGDLVACITLVSPSAVAAYLLDSVGAALKAKDASATVVDSMVASLSARIGPAFVEFAPVGTYCVVADGSVAVARLDSSPDIAAALAIPDALSSHHLDQHGLPRYFDTLHALRPPYLKKLGALSVPWDAYAAVRGSGDTHTTPDTPPPPPLAATTVVLGDGAEDSFDKLVPDAGFVDVGAGGDAVAAAAYDAGAAGPSSSAASALGAHYAPVIAKVTTRFDVFSRVLEVRVIGSQLAGVVRIKFRGCAHEYDPVTVSDSLIIFRVAQVPAIAGANWASVTLRVITHFGEGRVKLGLGRFVNAMYLAHHMDGLVAQPRAPRASAASLPGVSVAVSQLGLARAVRAVVKAVEDRDVFEGLVRSYLFSDAFQEQLAEASDVELALSVVNVVEVRIPEPAVTLDAATNTVGVTFADVYIRLQLGFEQLVLSPYLTYSQVGAEFEVINLHGALSVGVGRTGSGASYTVNLDDLAVELGSELEDAHGNVVTHKDNWGYSASLLRLFLGSMRSLFLWVMGGASLKAFLQSELESVLVGSSLARVPYGDTHALLVDYTLTSPPDLVPDMDEDEGRATKFVSAHCGRITLEGFEGDEAYEDVAPPASFEPLLSRVTTYDVVVCISPFVLNTALVSAFLAGWTNVTVAEAEIPTELRALVEVDGEIDVVIRATAPPTVVFGDGEVVLTASTVLQVRTAADSAVAVEAAIPFTARVDVAQLSVGVRGLEGLEDLELVGADGRGLAKAAVGVGQEWAGVLRQLYTERVVPAFARVLAGSGVKELRLFQGAPRGAGAVYVDDACICVTFEIPEFSLAPEEVSELKDYLRAQSSGPGDSVRTGVDRGLGWVEGWLRSFHRLPTRA